MNASQISCFFSLGFFDSTTQRLPLEGTPSEPVGQVFSNISWVRLKKKNHKSNHPWPLCQAWPRWQSAVCGVCFKWTCLAPATLLGSKVFPSWQCATNSTNSTRPWVKSQPRYPRLYDHADVSATFQGAAEGGAVYGSHVPLEIWFDMNFVFRLQRLEHEFQECFRILPRNK